MSTHPLYARVPPTAEARRKHRIMSGRRVPDAELDGPQSFLRFPRSTSCFDIRLPTTTLACLHTPSKHGKTQFSYLQLPYWSFVVVFRVVFDRERGRDTTSAIKFSTASDGRPETRRSFASSFIFASISSLLGKYAAKNLKVV